MHAIRWGALVAPLALLFALSPEARADDCTTTLWAGQFDDVGSLALSLDAETGDLTVDYTVDAEWWYLTETHLYVGDAEDCPIKMAPGKFPYKDDDLATTTHSYTVSTEAAALEDLCIAAHAVVAEYAGCEGKFEAVLPDTVTMTVAHPGSGYGDPSYFDVTITGGLEDDGVTANTFLDGTFDDWCVDVGSTISPGSSYTAYVYSSYDTDGWGYVDEPENFDLVNWVINQDWTSQTSTCTDGVTETSYTYGDVQRAIWDLIDDTNSTSGIGSTEACRVSEIVADAWANGEGFEPGCDESVAILLVPTSGAQVTVAQVTVAELGIDCDECGNETAWGELSEEVDKSWGWYGTCPTTVPDVGED